MEEKIKDIKVKDIIKICNVKEFYGNEEIICENFSKDTREIEENDVYVGIKGETFNGNEFYEQAFEKGAKVCILQGIEINDSIKEKYSDRAIIIVEDTIKALQDIATYKRSLYDIPVVAITGSVGKTSTKDIIASVVSMKYDVLKTQGNLNNHIGLPLTILKLKNHNALVVEMGMNHLGEISVLSKIAKPNIAVITNVGTAHIGNLGSRENILKAKLEILDGLSENGTLIINNDNDLLHDWSNKEKSNSNVEIVTYGIENESQFTATNISLKENSSEFEIQSLHDKEEIYVPIAGTHFIYNALSAIAVGSKLNIPLNKIKEGIQKFELTKNRMELINLKNGITIVNDCYNANYDSMKASIEYIGKVSGKRKIAILGDMLELGEFSEELHKKTGEEIIKNNIDILITVGKMGKVIADTVKSADKNSKINVYQCESNKEAIEIAKGVLESNEIILIKASNGMKFKEITEELVTV